MTVAAGWAAPGKAGKIQNQDLNMISLQTNVTSLEAQNNLNTDNLVQSNVIQQLSSGYRINKSGDDAAGLAIANGYRDNIAELTQGVNNANDGIAQLQIVDGGLSNISTILDRMKTLATESASGTFTGNRSTLNDEYQGLIAEITRQATNINLNAGGSFNSKLNVYIGGASNLANAAVTIDLSGTQNAVDATSLGVASTNVLGGGVTIGGNTQALNTPGATFLSGSNTQTFTFNLYTGGSAQTVAVTVNGGPGGLTESQAMANLNGQLSQYGITASANSNGYLQFSGSTAFTVSAAAASGGTGLTSGAGTAENSSNYIVDGQTTYAAPATGESETLQFQTSNGSVSVSIAAGTTLANAITDINAATASLGVYAVKNAAGTGISFQSASSFTINDSQSGTGTAAAAIFSSTSGTYTGAAPTTSATSNATAAITAVDSAIQNLGLAQGRVGAGENLLQYAINLANSQITNFSTAQSDIRDANVAADASQMTQSQVLEQTAVAAMAQANSSTQVVLKLLQ
jgi:flagellin